MYMHAVTVYCNDRLDVETEDTYFKKHSVPDPSRALSNSQKSNTVGLGAHGIQR